MDRTVQSADLRSHAVRSRLRTLGTAGCMAVLLCAGAFAHAAPPLPPEQHQGSVAFVSGGVAEDEAGAFQQAAKSWPLSIEIVQRAGARNEYTADARVEVVRADGMRVLDAKARGPFMLVRLPPGRYKVQASLGGRTVESGTVSVTGRGSQRAMLVFPESRS